MKRHLDFSNTSPAYSIWRILEHQREPVRRRLARFFRCSPEEIALTRNASESLQICQNGFDLNLGYEVLTTTHDYGRMINTFKQRMIKAKQEYQKNPSKELTREIARCHNIQWSKKIALNSAYGAVGNQYFRYYDVRQASGITCLLYTSDAADE